MEFYKNSVDISFCHKEFKWDQNSTDFLNNFDLGLKSMQLLVSLLESISAESTLLGNINYLLVLSGVCISLYV